jgi:hypothetical protein
MRFFRSLRRAFKIYRLNQDLEDALEKLSKKPERMRLIGDRALTFREYAEMLQRIWKEA